MLTLLVLLGSSSASCGEPVPEESGIASSVREAQLIFTGEITQVSPPPRVNTTYAIVHQAVTYTAVKVLLGPLQVGQEITVYHSVWRLVPGSASLPSELPGELFRPGSQLVVMASSGWPDEWWGVAPDDDARRPSADYLARVAGLIEQRGPQPSVASPAVEVELQVFSGRENPGWKVTDPADVARLRGFFAGLAQVPEPPGSRGGLGYAGFFLRADESALEFPRQVYVWRGFLEVTSKSSPKSRWFRDERGLEAFLRSEAQRRGLGVLMRRSKPRK